jgi:hypothetical protein
VITCTVHERTSDEGSIEARAERIVFVREGIAWWALLFPLIWLLYHRQWLVIAGFVAVLVALNLVIGAADLGEVAGAALNFGISLILALEGNNLRRWTLGRKGYTQVDVATGRDQGECEQRFFDRWIEEQERRPACDMSPKQAAASPAPSNKPRASESGDGVIGLFPEANR